MTTIAKLGLSALALAAGLWVLLGLPSRGERKVDAYFAALRSDLRRVARAEAAHFAATGRYTAALDSLSDPQTGFSVLPSLGVEIVVLEADSAGWAAVGTHVELPTRCVYRDDAPPRPVPSFSAFRDFCVDAP